MKEEIEKLLSGDLPYAHVFIERRNPPYAHINLWVLFQVVTPSQHVH